MTDDIRTHAFPELFSYKALEKHFKKIEKLHMRRLFSVDPTRFEHFSIEHNGLLLDYSKNRITQTTLSLLLDLAKERKVTEMRDNMFSGTDFTHSQNYSTLRQFNHSKAQSSKLAPAILRTRNKIREFSDDIRTGDWKGYTGKHIKSVINIGVDDSDLGAKTLHRALKDDRDPSINTHYISDTQHISALLEDISPESTLFIISSPTFTAQETLRIATIAKKWILQAFSDKEALSNHFIAISDNHLAVQKFGIATEHLLELKEDFCYSIWGGVGLSTAITIGMDKYEEFLQGAYSMDEHFQEAPLEKSIPVILALLGVWYCNFFKTESHGIFPYDHRLSGLPRYIGQFDMQANSRSVNCSGEKIDYPTSPVIFGTTESNSQHAFYQALHQGLKLIPCDFISSVQGGSGIGQSHQDMVFANMLAQSESLMRGRNLDESYTSLPPSQQTLIQQKNLRQLVFEGNNPSNILLLDKVSPFSMGMLITLYEHKAFVQSVLWDIKSTDHQGIEFEQHFSNQIMHEINQLHLTSSHDSSTNHLINHYKLSSNQQKIA